MEKQSKIFLILGYIYIILPVMIFLIGYCNLTVSLIGIGSILLGSYFVVKECPEIWIPQNKKEWCTIIVILFLVSVLVYFSGIGAYSYQTSDHNARNAIFELLVTQKWPVISQNKYILIYYIGFWLPAAMIGKLFNSVSIGYFIQFIWAIFGVFLFIYYVLAIFKKKLMLPLIIFVAFSGLDILGSILLDFANGVSPLNNSLNLLLHLEWWFSGYQFSSFVTQLFWVFNQAIPAWIVVMLLLHQKDNKNMIFIYSCLFICSTLPAIGLFPILAYLCLKNDENDIKLILKKEHIINSLKCSLSVQNIVGALIIIPITYLYLSGNFSGQHITNAIQSQVINIEILKLWFFLFFMLEVGLYLLCVWKNQKKDPLFYIVLLSFIVYPFIQVGYGADFCMRATIPSLVILYLYVVNLFYDNNKSNQHLKIFVIILLIFGCNTSLHEIYRNVYMTSIGVTKIKPELGLDNFFGYTENSLFLKYLGRRIQ